MRRAAGAVVVAGIVALAVIGVAGPASAHNQIVSTTPASGETLTTLPAEWRITTNLPLLDVTGDGKGFALQIRSAKGTYYGDGCLAIQDATMTEKAAIGPAGDYTVIWQLVSQDGHTVSGSFPFTWKPSGKFTAATGFDRPQNCGRADGSAATGAPADPDAARSQTIPLADVLWIGGALLLVAVAVVVAIVLLSRRSRGGEDGKDRKDDQSRA